MLNAFTFHQDLNKARDELSTPESRRKYNDRLVKSRNTSLEPWTISAMLTSLQLDDVLAEILQAIQQKESELRKVGV
jgi:hypothetical protein